jgi:tRNA-Thr(GGU) m(6)t(6)A37 methyltransferase TsaA
LLREEHDDERELRRVSVEMEPIGFVHTDVERVPRHWTVSTVEGTLVIDKEYLEGLKDIKAGQRIVVIFHFHRSQKFTSEFLVQKPPHRDERLGVFSICSPIRPNPLGMSVLKVLGIEKNIIFVKGLDMVDGTPILDIKPLVGDKESCPSFEGKRRPNTP